MSVRSSGRNDWDFGSEVVELWEYTFQLLNFLETIKVIILPNEHQHVDFIVSVWLWSCEIFFGEVVEWRGGPDDFIFPFIGVGWIFWFCACLNRHSCGPVGYFQAFCFSSKKHDGVGPVVSAISWSTSIDFMYSWIWYSRTSSHLGGWVLNALQGWLWRFVLFSRFANLFDSGSENWRARV